jgi:hypothetical protein
MDKETISLYGDILAEVMSELSISIDEPNVKIRDNKQKLLYEQADELMRSMRFGLMADNVTSTE